MKVLFKIIVHNGVNVVLARDLHSFLGSKTDFIKWIKGNINKYGFIGNQDFFWLNDCSEINNTGYILSLDCAKILSIVECSSKGRKAFRYLVDYVNIINESEKKGNNHVMAK
jgi:anti-repressor protein